MPQYADFRNNSRSFATLDLPRLIPRRQFRPLIADAARMMREVVRVQRGPVTTLPNAH